MGRLIIHEHPDAEAQALARAQRFAALSTGEKLNQLFVLIRLSVTLNGGKSLREPQGKGLVIRKQKIG